MNYKVHNYVFIPELMRFCKITSVENRGSLQVVRVLKGKDELVCNALKGSNSFVTRSIGSFVQTPLTFYRAGQMMNLFGIIAICATILHFFG